MQQRVPYTEVGRFAMERNIEPAEHNMLILPCARRWRQHDFERHKQNLTASHSLTDSNPPETRPHVRPDNAKAIYLRAVRQAEVGKENDRLLNEVGRCFMSHG